MYVAEPGKSVECVLTLSNRLARVSGGTDTPEGRKKLLGTIPLGRVVSLHEVLQ